MNETRTPLFSPDSIPNGLLSSPQILMRLKERSLAKNWKPSCLKSASYEMRLGNFSCWHLAGVRRVQRHGPEIDANKNIQTSLSLPPSSLTFVTIIEEFLMPRDMIARFNLVSRRVRKGLLIGAAPIVEPRFSGHLLIPARNFSGNPVQIAFGEPFIAVEFAKTLPIDNSYVVNADPVGNIQKYIDETDAVDSSLSAAINKNEKVCNDIASKTKIFSIAGAIALFLLICSNMTLLVNIFNSAKNARKPAIQAKALSRNTPPGTTPSIAISRIVLIDTKFY